MDQPKLESSGKNIAGPREFQSDLPFKTREPESTQCACEVSFVQIWYIVSLLSTDDFVFATVSHQLLVKPLKEMGPLNLVKYLKCAKLDGYLYVGSGWYQWK